MNNDKIIFSENEEEYEENDHYFEEYEEFYQDILAQVQELKSDFEDTNGLIDRIQSKLKYNKDFLEKKKREGNENFVKLKNEIEKTSILDERLEKMELEEVKNFEETLQLQIKIRKELLNIINEGEDLQNKSQALYNNTNAFFALCKEFNEQISISPINMEDKLEKKEKEESSTKNQVFLKNFIERNIQLSGNGCGALSMTNEEHDRVDNLMKDESIKKDETKDTQDDIHTTMYDKTEVDTELNEIDTKLKKLPRYSSKVQNNEKAISHEDWKDEIKLNEINKMIEEISRIDKEVEPVDEKKIAELIGAYSATKSEDEDDDSDLLSLSDEKIKELILEAEKAMPKFKYRHSLIKFDEI